MGWGIRGEERIKEKIRDNERDSTWYSSRVGVLYFHQSVLLSALVMRGRSLSKRRRRGYTRSEDVIREGKSSVGVCGV